jgi:hypothetical protein
MIDLKAVGNSVNLAQALIVSYRFPLLAIRLKNTFQGYPNRLSVRPNSLGLYAETNSILYEVVKFPSVASLSTTNPGGLVWTSADSNSGVEYCVNATSFVSADGDRFASGYVPSGSSQNSLNSKLIFQILHLENK